MKYLPLLLANLRRKPLRLIFTLLSVIVAFLLFGLLVATREAFTGTIELVGSDRLITVNKVSLIQPLPLSYANRIRGVPGVQRVAWALFIGAYYQDPKNFLPAAAVDTEGYLGAYPEILISDETRARWRQDRTAAIVGKTLAAQYNWKVGDRVPVQSQIWTNADGGHTWEVTIAGTYDVSNEAFDTSSMLIRYDYFNESLITPLNQVNFYIERVRRGADVATVSNRVDDMFVNSPAETDTSTEKAWAQGMISQIADIGAIVTSIVSAVFFSMLLVIAVTMAQSVRERTSELAVLKALGYQDREAFGLVLAESMIITLGGALVGLVGAWMACAPIRARIGQYLPNFYMRADDAALGVALALAMGLIAGAWPGWQALRLRVATALRRT